MCGLSTKYEDQIKLKIKFNISKDDEYYLNQESLRLTATCVPKFLPLICQKKLKIWQNLVWKINVKRIKMRELIHILQKITF